MIRRDMDAMADGLGRRQLMAGAGALALAAYGLPSRAAWAADRIVVADPGGPFGPAFQEAFHKPFRAATGIESVQIAREHEPTTQIKAQVEAKSYTWDVVTLTLSARDLLHSESLLETIDWSGSDMAEIMPEARHPAWMGTDVYATILAYRTDKYGSNPPKSWADFFNVEKFPGRRAMRKHPIDTIEEALLADGVPLDKLYPLDVDRAFAKLDKIKKHVSAWWTGGAQTTQMLQSGEVDMVPTWNGRAQTIIDAGGPVAIEWNQGLYSIEGWAIPKGNPKAALGKKFIQFCANAERQAVFTKTLAYGPTNPNAYKFITAERAKYLPTAPDLVKKMTLANEEWWAKHKDKVIERFNAWLLA